MFPKLDFNNEAYGRRRIKDSPLHSLKPSSKYQIPESETIPRKPVQIATVSTGANEADYVFSKCS